MQLTHPQTALMLGIVIPHLCSISMPSPLSDCLASVDICMSDLCRSQETFYNSICGDKGCQMKGFEVCNLTVQNALHQFPSLRGCACAWEDDLCDSVLVLAAQCHGKPAARKMRSALTHWQSSSLIGYVYNGGGSCTDQVTVCITDAVCNRFLAPVLQVCMAEQCDPARCQQVTQHFYGSMPANVAEMLFMCECEGSDRSCMQMKTALHSSTCRVKTMICLDTIADCVEDSNCRESLKTFQTKCWSPEDAECSELRKDECFIEMDPALILGADSECKAAFLATLGTILQHPCSCEGLQSNHLLTCNRIHDVLHNRSHFMTYWKSSSGPSKPPETNESVQGHTWSYDEITDILLLPLAIVLLFGLVILMPLTVFIKLWILRRKNTKCHHPQKRNCVVIL